MGRVSFSEQYRDEASGGSVEKFEQLKLAAGQQARILCFEQPWSEYVHDLRKPVVDEAGQLLFETKKRKDGSEFSVPKTDWSGRPICLGDEQTIKDNQIDPANCPACDESRRNKRIEPPKRRYAMNVVLYHTFPNGQLAQPFAAKFVVWGYTAKMYDRLYRISQDHNGMLQEHDLRIGPPEDPVIFQRFDVHALPSTGWREAGEPGFRFLQALMNAPGAKATDEQLREACGRKITRAFMEQDVQAVVQAWFAAENRGAPAPVMAGAAAFAGQQSLQDGFAQAAPGMFGQPPANGANGQPTPFGQPFLAPGTQTVGATTSVMPAQPAPSPFPGGAPFPTGGAVPQAQPGASPFGAGGPGAPFGSPAQAAPPAHPLEQQAAAQSAAASPFGAPGIPPAGIPGAAPSGYGEAPAGNPFGQPAPQAAPPLQPHAAPGTPVPPAQPQAQPAPQSSPFGSVQPAAAPQGFAPMPPSVMQPAPVPAGAAAAQPGDLDFNSFWNPGQQ